jgi:hypothetical protein
MGHPCDGAVFHVRSPRSIVTDGQVLEHLLQTVPEEVVRLEGDWGPPLLTMCVAGPDRVRPAAAAALAAAATVLAPRRPAPTVTATVRDPFALSLCMCVYCFKATR